MDTSFWILINTGGDDTVCRSENEAHHEYRSLFSGDRGYKARMNSGARVFEFNPVEGWSRDVTMDFADWSADEADDDADNVAWMKNQRHVRSMRTYG